METPNISQNGSTVAGAEDFTGHWQPALRPDTLSSSQNRPPFQTPDAQIPSSPSPDDDVSVFRQPKTTTPPSIAVSKPQPMPLPNRTVNSISTQKPDMRLYDEKQSAPYASVGKGNMGGTVWGSTQDSLRSPLVGLSWSKGRNGLPDDDAELSSDEDNERLDPAWGINRTESAQILKNVTRTTSFPDFGQSTFSSNRTPAPKLSTSQVEQIMEEQDKKDSWGDNGEYESNYEAVDLTESEALVGSAPTVTEQSQYNFTSEDGTENSNARFEEGVPLIPSEPEKVEISENETVHKESLDEVFNNPAVKEDTSFFDGFNSASPNSAKPAPLDRKTTSDVFDSMHFSPEGPPDSPVRSEPFDQLRNEDSDAIDFDQLATNQVAEVDDEDAMWKAALADDEFLVEDPDDLLPESPPDSPSSFLGSLRNDTAIENEQPLTSQHDQLEPQAGLTLTPKRDSKPEFGRQSSSNPYAPHQPSNSDQTQLSPTTYANIGLTRPGLAPMNSFQQHLQQRSAAPQAAQSFVDQSKGGYKSPYDLPLELSKPRKRVQAAVPSPALKSMPLPPPPRSSSMSSDKQLNSPFSPTNTTFPSLARVPSAQAPPIAAQRNVPAASPPQPANKPRSSSNSFFEELPISSRPRPPTSQGRYTPQQNTSMPPPQLLPRSPPSRQSSQSQPQPPPPRPVADPYAQYQLRPPERLDPYANVPLQVPTSSISPATSMRYSPAPVISQIGPKPSPSPRYSTAPPLQGGNTAYANRYASQPAPPSEAPTGFTPPPNRYASQQTSNSQPPNTLPFQPRTSSPLAYHGRPVNEQSRQPPSRIDRNASASYLPDPTSSFRPQGQESTVANVSGIAISSPSRPAFIPPNRSQPQSPGKGGAMTAFPTLSDDASEMPASVHAEIPPPRAFPQLETHPPPRPSVRQRGLTQTFDFIEPNDGQQLDDLKRWKGAPVFRFGFGGSTISSFPKHIPRYSAGMTTPMIKPSAGEVVLRSTRDVLPLSDGVASFPGPLRTKAKKKEVLSWLTSYISVLEQGQPTLGVSQPLPDPQRRHEEKVLLWKIVRALVEHDGVLDTGADARKSVNKLLSPEIFALDESTASQYPDGSDSHGIYRPAGTNARSDPVDPVVVETLRKSLLRGDREKAVWGAVDNRLWAHALLISSTLDRTVWKQVVQEFVRQEVKVIGANTESLAAVYEIFAGNLEESIDELVPPSARAGLQMVSKVDNIGPAKNALDGLNRWRETLGLVLNNRTPDDTQALAALGRLLARYGRVEAAHICYLFSRAPLQPSIFGGADDPQTGVVLLGADHQGMPLTFFRDNDAVLLTEVYEFATSILASGAVSSAIPHFQVYKLQRAISLAENGRKAEAQAYCDGIAGSLKSNTKMSPYFHPMFFSELDELTNRLKQAPLQSSSSWIAKPSIEKVSGSVWNKFSSFVAGEDSDAESKGSGKDANHEFGPFAKITGTPSLSRSGSQTDLYGAYSSNVPAAIPNTIAGSRYAPNGMHSARSSSELTRGRTSLDSQRSPPSASLSQVPRSGSFEPPLSFGQHAYMPQATTLYQPLSQSPPTSRTHATPPQTSYIPNNMLQESPQLNFSARQPESYIPTPPPEPQTSYMPTPPPAADPMPAPAEHPSFGGYSRNMPTETEPAQDEPDPSYNTNYDPPAQSYGYEPPADTGYVPYEPEPDSDSESDAKKAKPRQKKSFMDDEDDDFRRISNGMTSIPQPPSDSYSAEDSDAAARKRANDAAADAAFKAAAEADAAREKEKAASLKSKPSGWGLGGWFGGKKPDSLDASSSSGGKGTDAKVHRAHLGESKMTLQYDKNLKKWIDPSNPDSLKQKTATPPPPRMGGPAMGKALPPSAGTPVLSTSGSGPGSVAGSVGPPSGPPSRMGTPADGPGSAAGMAPMMQPPGSSGPPGPPSGTGTPPPGIGAGPGMLAPPSRPATSMSNASSIDDLLGPATGAASGRRTVKGKKVAKRYVDIMAQ